MAEPLTDFSHLSAEERIRLAEALWDSLGGQPDAAPLTPTQEAELDRRVAEYREDGDPGTPWREVLKAIERRSS